MAKSSNRYSQLIETVFFKHYRNGDTEVSFDRSEFEAEAKILEIDLPKNQGDIVYSFRYRTALPERILALCGPEEEWTIHGVGRGRYQFRKGPATRIAPQADLLPAKIPNATPSIVDQYAIEDEQAVLTKIRYNRLIDLTTGMTAYSLQNHLRTTLKSGSQIEIDELYVGVDKHGVQYIVPVQAKGGNDRIGRAQLEQDIAYCAEIYPDLVCLPIAAQFMAGGVIAMLQLTIADDRVQIVQEKHYKLVQADEISGEDLRLFRRLMSDSGD
jgi:hypothetical protein